MLIHNHAEKEKKTPHPSITINALLPSTLPHPSSPRPFRNEIPPSQSYVRACSNFTPARVGGPKVNPPTYLHARADPHLLDHFLILHHQPPSPEDLLQRLEDPLEGRLGALLLREAGDGDVGAAAAVQEGVELGGDGEGGDAERCDWLSQRDRVRHMGDICWYGKKRLVCGGDGKGNARGSELSRMMDDERKEMAHTVSDVHSRPDPPCHFVNDDVTHAILSPIAEDAGDFLASADF